MSADDAIDLYRTEPGTLAGRYLRSFWQPVWRARDLAAGEAVPLRIMSEDFTLYRGETGAPHVVAFAYDVVARHLVVALDRVEDVEPGQVRAGHRVTGLLEHPAEVGPEHAGGAGDEDPGHQRASTCWVRAYRASVASFIGRHHTSFSRYQSMVAARPSRKLP